MSPETREVITVCLPFASACAFVGCVFGATITWLIMW